MNSRCRMGSIRAGQGGTRKYYQTSPQKCVTKVTDASGPQRGLGHSICAKLVSSHSPTPPSSRLELDRLFPLNHCCEVAGEPFR